MKPKFRRDKEEPLDISKVVLKLSQSRKVFPAQVTKIRMPTDLIHIVNSKAEYMNNKEVLKTMDLVKRWDEKNFEFLAKRRKNKIKFIPFDE